MGGAIAAVALGGYVLISRYNRSCRYDNTVTSGGGGGLMSGVALGVLAEHHGLIDSLRVYRAILGF